MTWIEAAEACQLSDLRLGLVRQLACCLAAVQEGNLADTMARTGVLAQCDPSTLLQVIGLLTAAGTEADKGYQLAGCIPSRPAVTQAAAAVVRTGTFDWMLTHFSQRTSVPGQRVVSPWLFAAGE